MRIEAYFHQLQTEIAGFVCVISSNVSYDTRGSFVGFVRGELILIDGSMLHFREFVDTQSTVERDTYAYQYMTADGQLIFRYDNSDHHWKLNLSTHPHHKHDGSQQHIVAASTPTLLDVLVEIEQLVQTL